MRPDDEDDEEGFGPPPDPSLRPWRHPSEIASAEAAAARFAAADAAASGSPAGPLAGLTTRLHPTGGHLALVTTLAVTIAAVTMVAGLGLAGSDTLTAGDGSAAGPKGSARSILTSDLGATAVIPPAPAGTDGRATTTSVVTASTITTVATTAGSPLNTTDTALTARTATTLVNPDTKVMAVQQGVWAPVGGVDTRLAAFTVIDDLVVTVASAVDGHGPLTLVFGGRSVPAAVLIDDPVTDLAVLTAAPPTAGTGAATGTGSSGPSASGSGSPGAGSTGPGSTSSGTAAGGGVADDGAERFDDLIDAVADSPTSATAVTGSVVKGEQITRNRAGQRLYGLLLTTTMCPEGAAGAPLVDASGQVVGLVIDSASSLVHAIPAGEVAEIAASLADHGVASPVWLGVDGETHTDGTAHIHTVDAGGPAARAGLAPGDVVVSVDGVAVSEWHHFIYLLREAGPRAEVTLAISRGGTTLQVPVTIGSR